MNRIIIALVLSFFSISSTAQGIQRPKLVVGIVVDQMRWDYLYRFYDRYDAKGGFKRFLNQGFSCENTLINYAPTVTACGHSSVYTGSIPAISGITGNVWWDKQKMRPVYCVEDNSVSTIGGSSTLGKMSPKNMLVTTISDELRLATNFHSKVIGVAIKDRGGILPAGHSANAAYWYENTTGNWITSSYYMDALPAWVSNFNSQKRVDKYYQQGWKLSYPVTTYYQSTEDIKKYEGNPLGAAFPYDLNGFVNKNYAILPVTPYGNTLTAEFAKAAITAEQLGADQVTDMIAVSFSSPDYIGHTFGPNSVEAEDALLKLDKELGDFFDFLDAKVGKGQYTVFLTADHAVSQIPEFLKENKLPGGRVFMSTVTEKLNKLLSDRYKMNRIIVSDDNYQMHLDHHRLDSAKVNKKELIDLIIDSLSSEPGIARVFSLLDLNTVPLPATIRTMLNNGYYPGRSGDIQYILQSHYIDAFSNTGTTHGLWNPYDSHIPLLWYGWGIKQGKMNRETHMTDIAPTLAALLRIQMPSGCIGNVISEVLK
jgi:predicted AlkP superfamily pyrophosphatase or phosphodiesterase